jgi:hypothetical protein
MPTKSERRENIKKNKLRKYIKKDKGYELHFNNLSNALKNFLNKKSKTLKKKI